MHRRSSTHFLNGDSNQNDKNSSALASAQLIMRPTASLSNLNKNSRKLPSSRYQSNVDQFIAQFNEDTDIQSQTSRFYTSESGMNRKVNKKDKRSKFKRGRKSKKASNIDSSSNSISRASSTDSDAIVVIAEESETEKQKKRKPKHKRRARSIEDFGTPMVIGTPNPMYYPKLLNPNMNFGVHPAFVPGTFGGMNPYYAYTVGGYPQPEYYPNDFNSYAYAAPLSYPLYRTRPPRLEQ